TGYDACPSSAPPDQKDRCPFSRVNFKRLEADHFVWPRREETVIGMTAEQLHWLLDGIDVDAMRRHPARQYHHANARRCR
ncbi:IS66 family insertion sequence element accessory protein TnpB, partial [Paraburkholderia sp. SARCC-3016]|uniref:IS66 family insertion sequence element accessory protein TnpB n=1 Tax=Paraburkholderia sp. SARCC-3016 TaxID=3058611 RepID=UPI0028096F16